MRRRQIVFAVLLLMVGLLILVLALRNPAAPFLPDDEDHAVSDLASCLDCHDVDGAVPRAKNHPLGNDCFRCHARR